MTPLHPMLNISGNKNATELSEVCRHPTLATSTLPTFKMPLQASLGGPHVN